MQIFEIERLLHIGGLAVAAHGADVAVRQARACLDDAYTAYKEDQGLDYVEKYSDDWDAMIVATSTEYADLVRKKKDLHNIKRKLERAIRRRA